jgi:hypothetical protein
MIPGHGGTQCAAGLSRTTLPAYFLLCVRRWVVLARPVGHGTVFQTAPQAGMGLYFFAASCVLSMLTMLLGAGDDA